MALFDFLRGRRERESAMGASQLGALEPVLQEAMRTGGADVTVTQGPAQVMGLQGQGEDLREAIIATLRRNGIDAEKGQEIQVTDPGLQREIFRTLADHGVDIGAVAGAVATDPAVPMGGEDVVGRLERLQRLREQGALTDAEFKAQKRQILGR